MCKIKLTILNGFFSTSTEGTNYIPGIWIRNSHEVGSTDSSFLKSQAGNKCLNHLSIRTEGELEPQPNQRTQNHLKLLLTLCVQFVVHESRATLSSHSPASETYTQSDLVDFSYSMPLAMVLDHTSLHGIKLQILGGEPK